MCGVVIWVTAEVQRCSNVIAVVHRCVNGFGLMFTPRSETLRPSCQILTCVWCVICVVMRCGVFMAVCRDVITALICMSVTTASLMIQNLAQTQGRVCEWMWSGLCAGGSLCQRCCRRPEFLPCDPHTLLFWSWPLEGVQSFYYCDRKRICCCGAPDSRTDHYIQTHTHEPLLSCWCFYMRLIS